MKNINWSRTNAELARSLKISKDRVRRMRPFGALSAENARRKTSAKRASELDWTKYKGSSLPKVSKETGVCIAVLRRFAPEWIKRRVHPRGTTREAVLARMSPERRAEWEGVDWSLSTREIMRRLKCAALTVERLRPEQEHWWSL